jgi:hypothetical protein
MLLMDSSSFLVAPGAARSCRPQQQTNNSGRLGGTVGCVSHADDLDDATENYSVSSASAPSRQDIVDFLTEVF